MSFVHVETLEPVASTETDQHKGEPSRQPGALANREKSFDQVEKKPTTRWPSGWRRCEWAPRRCRRPSATADATALGLPNRKGVPQQDEDKAEEFAMLTYGYVRNTGLQNLAISFLEGHADGARLYNESQLPLEYTYKLAPLARQPGEAAVHVYMEDSPVPCTRAGVHVYMEDSLPPCTRAAVHVYMEDSPVPCTGAAVHVYMEDSS